MQLADLYSIYAGALSVDSNRTANEHRNAATQLRDAILDLFWDPGRLAFYDFDLETIHRKSFFSAAHFYPLWAGIVPQELIPTSKLSQIEKDELERKAAVAYGAALDFVLTHFEGLFPATFKETGQQWDMPNAWPPHQHIILEALSNVPSELATKPLSKIFGGKGPFTQDTLLRQLHMTEEDLKGLTSSERTELKERQGETWAKTLQRILANRYMASVLCSW